MPQVKLGSEVYDEIPKEALSASKAVVFAWEATGKPTTPLSTSGKKVMDVIIAVWEDLYPIERKLWLEERETYKKAELSIKEQIRKRTGRSLGSYPYPIYQMMKKVFPKFNSTERKNMIKMVGKWKMFQFTNKV